MSEQVVDAEVVFLAALDMATSRERFEYVEDACAGDVQLLERVRELLAAHDESQGPLDVPPPGMPGVVGALQGSERPGSSFGRYKLLQLIGEGGMGSVWMAEQTRPVRRKVALKLIKPGMDSSLVLARFEAERQALALMDHPHIARVLDAGETPPAYAGGSPRPYFVMDLVKGLPITRYCDEYGLTTRQRLELFLPVCQAIQHAHHKGVIHRDIKPSNVLVAPYDGRPVVKVIDFGVAKATEQRLTEHTLFTEFGAVVGTLEYMSPEQAELNNQDIDTRSDIYSLGVLLYELLTGTVPLTRARLRGAGLADRLRMIREEEPPKPSTRLLASNDTMPAEPARRQTEPAKLAKLMRGELDWIVMKALEKDRNRRYETANGLAMDVQRYLDDEPVQACPPSAWYRFQKFARRNKSVLATAALLGGLLVAAIIGLAVSNFLIAREKEEKESALKKAQENYRDAEANLLLARQAVDEIYTPVGEQLAQVPHMQPFQRDVLEKTLRFYREFAKRKGSDPAILLETACASLRVLQILHALGQRAGNETASREVIASLQQLADVLPSDPKRRLWLGGAHAFLGAVHAGAGRSQEAVKNYRQSLALYGELGAEFSDDPEYQWHLAITHNTLGSLQQDRPGEAEKHHREAIHLCEELATTWPDKPIYRGELAHSWYCLGVALAGWKRLQEAESAFVQASAIFEEGSEPLNRSSYRMLLAVVQNALGGRLAARGRSKEAETAIRRAVGVAEACVSQFPDFPQYRQILANGTLALAQLLARTGRQEEAVIVARRAIEIVEKLLAESLDDSQPKEHSIETFLAVGISLRDAGEFQGAEKAYRKALDLARKLTEDFPAELGHLHTLAKCQSAVAVTLQRADRSREAAEMFREPLAIYERLAAAQPNDPDYRFYLATSANFLGVALRALPKETEECLLRHRQAIALCDRLVSQHPDQHRYRQQLVRGHYAVGLALWNTGRWQDVKAAYLQALAASAPLPDQTVDPTPSVHNNLAWLFATCPEESIRDPQRAVDLAEKAVELDPKSDNLNTLGVAQYRARNWDAAVTALGKSMKLGNGGHSYDWFFLAMAYWQKGDREEARKSYDKAVQWMDKHAPKDAELRRFRKEAEDLLGLKEKKD